MLPLALRSLITLRHQLFQAYTNPWQILFFPCILFFSLIVSHIYLSPTKLTVLHSRTSCKLVCTITILSYVIFLSALFCFLYSTGPGMNCFLFPSTISFFPPPFPSSLHTSLSFLSFPSFPSFTQLYKYLKITDNLSV